MKSAPLVIRGARILDGTGAPEREGDIAISAGRIVDIGSIPEADEVIEAKGLTASPGFIDLHSHGDLVLAWPSVKRLPLLEGRLAQGITTEIVGNCGLGAGPLFGDGEAILRQLNGWMSPADFDWDWRGFDGYFDHLEHLGVPVNVGALVPHGPLRLGAMGLTPGPPEAESFTVMESALNAALEAGTFGLSAGLIYPPGMYTATDELVRLARRLRPSDGLFTCHLRGSSETLLRAVDELIDIGRAADVRVHHSHAEAVGRAHWGKLEAFLQREDGARRDGVRLSVDMFPYPVAATMMLAIYPPWSLEGGLQKLLERLQTASERRRIERDIEERTPEWPPWMPGGWPHNLVHAVGWDRILIASVGSDRNRGVEGLSLAELGERRGSSPFDAVSDLMVEENGIVGQFVLDISGEAGLERLISQPNMAFITDANDYGKGKPHPAAYGSFPRIFARYSRAKSLLGLPEAVRRITSLPADILGIRDRGRLERGAWADIVLFDPQSVVDRATLDKPRQKSEGIELVLVNGQVAYRRGSLTGALPGRVVRRGSDA